MVNQRAVRTTLHWILIVLVIVYLITGFGITKYRIVETLTFGLLTKSLSQRIHTNIEIPFIILLVLHIWLLPLLRHLRSRKLRHS